MTRLLPQMWILLAFPTTQIAEVFSGKMYAVPEISVKGFLRQISVRIDKLLTAITTVASRVNFDLVSEEMCTWNSNLSLTSWNYSPVESVSSGNHNNNSSNFLTLILFALEKYTCGKACTLNSVLCRLWNFRSGQVELKNYFSTVCLLNPFGLFFVRLTFDLTLFKHYQ